MVASLVLVQEVYNEMVSHGMLFAAV